MSRRTDPLEATSTTRGELLAIRDAEPSPIAEHPAPARRRLPETVAVLEDLLDGRPLRLGWWDGGKGFVLTASGVDVAFDPAAGRALANAIYDALELDRRGINAGYGR